MSRQKFESSQNFGMLNKKNNHKKNNLNCMKNFTVYIKVKKIIININLLKTNIIKRNDVKTMKYIFIVIESWFLSVIINDNLFKFTFKMILFT